MIYTYNSGISQQTYTCETDPYWNLYTGHTPSFIDSLLFDCKGYNDVISWTSYMNGSVILDTTRTVNIIYHDPE